MLFRTMAGPFWMVILAFTLGTVVSQSDLFSLSYGTPRYFQAHISFALAKQYIQQNLPSGDIANITIKNVNFGVLVGVTGRLVQASLVNPRQSDPETLIEQHAQYMRQHYTEVAKAMHDILEEANKKVEPIFELINRICTPSSYFDCNTKIEAEVLRNTFTLRIPAILFIRLGRISKNIMHSQILIESLVNNDEVVPFLTQNVRDTLIDKLIKKMARIYTIMKMMDTISI